MASSRVGGSGGSASDSDSDSENELDVAVEAAIDRLLRQRQQRRQQQAAVPRPIERRNHVPRDHIAAHMRLFQDYFAPQPRFGDSLFRRRFRMHRPLFMHIVGALERRYEYFRIREDAAGKPGHTPLQKCTAAIRQLAYGGPADMFDEYLHIGESTAVECLKNFCAGVRAIFGDHYLRRPSPEDCQQLINMHGSVHGFPGMLGSIDCMHWEWKNCPAAWKGIYTTGFKSKHPTMILEAVADYRLWIWHAYFGVAGSNNDINVLQSSPLFNDQCNGVGPAISFVANGNQHNMGYYLADGIYPNWPVFVKTIKHAVGPQKSYFASRQEAARKDVERAFGVLQSRWAMVKGPSRMWYIPNIGDIMYACIILHNMIVESEGDELTQWTNEDDTGAGPSNGVASANVNMGVPHGEVERLRAFADMRQRDAHIRLQEDIIKEVWTRRDGR